jgi:peptidoglycan/LPS O-acetylase OafA/YrhL
LPEPSHVDATVRWRPSLGGVRGLAVLCVVAFHAGIPVQSGGVAGVTLFFVLSGYLIGTLLMREREATGTIDVQRFFARRAWRLLPALVAVMIALAMLRFAAGDAHELAEDSLLTLVYLANWARSAGDQMGWWNHAWSLSVEGQFYVLAPLTMLVLARAWRPSSQRLIVALVVAIGGVMLWRAALAEGGASSARIYFGTDTRADALLLGCLLAAIRVRHPGWSPTPLLGPIALFSFGLLAVLPLDVFGPSSGYGSIALASMGVVAGALGDDRGSRGLAARPLVWLGERSYSLYLVHVPVFMYLNQLLATLAPAVRVGTQVVVAVVLSALLFRYVERPLRHGLARGGRVVERVSRRRDEAGSALRLGPEVPA